MNILAIDTVSIFFSVSIISNGEVLETNTIHERNKSAELLLCTIEKLIDNYNLSYNNFSMFVVTRGPGSFMGIRIGISALQGLSLITQRPLYGLSRLEVIAFMLSKQNHNHDNIQAILNAGRDNIYYQCFSQDLTPLTWPRITNNQDLKTDGFLVGGDTEDTPHSIVVIPDSENAGLLAFEKINKNKGDQMEATPIYIRRAVAD